MSVLETPRILFRGQMSWDPITTNNYPAAYAEGACEPLPMYEAVSVYRRNAIQMVITGPGSWNPHGTHRSAFFETEVSGVDLGAGIVTDDPFVGAPVGFLGMLVDCEPYGSNSSQLFFDTMSFGIAGGCRVAAARDRRVIARYINFSRSAYNRMIAGIASVIWQTSFDKKSLQLDAQNSPALAMLNAAMESPDVLGLTVRWNAYRTIYYDDPCLRNGSPQTQARAQALIAKLKQGGWQPNPARSLIVGSLGLWRAGEPAQEPGDRALLAVPPAEIVATAFARIDGDRLTLDLGNSITEVDELLNKQNLGTLDIVLADKDDNVVAPLGQLNYHQYDRAAYDRGSGIVSLRIGEVEQAAAKDSNIQVRAGDGTIYLKEEPLRAVPTGPNIYVDEGESAAAGAAVFERGVPVGAGVQVTLFDGNSLAEVDTASTGADGIAHFTIASIPGGAVEPYILVAGPDPQPPAQLDTQITPYFYVRTLPADANIAALDPTWHNVYANVLTNWHALAPCMDNWLRLGDEAQVRAYAQVLRALTDPANFESYRFMPVTRDMTPGERTLLNNFLGAAPADESVAAAGGAPAAAPAKPRMRDLAKLSRSMRSPQ